MKICMKLVLLIISLYASNSLVHAELLVIKKGEQGFVPLDASDEVNKAAIADVFLKYEWPMVIANTALTKEEQDELLTSGVPYAEENFIRNKLKEIDASYDVVFIPTALYELFVIRFSKKMGNPRIDIDISGQLSGWQNTLENIYKVYRDKNSLFYPDWFLRINNALVRNLFNFDKTLNNYKDADMILDAIKNKASYFATFLIDEPDLFKNVKKKEVDKHNTDIIDPQSVLAKVIMLEYQARQVNKGLLLRGTYRISLDWLSYEAKQRNKNLTEKSRIYREPIELMGSTLYESELFGDIPQKYKQGHNSLYSISFGNSLFAGFIHDSSERGACAYSYLVKNGGYGIFIDKKNYIQRQSLSLFFIAPLAPIAAVFATGEWFHSRSKTAINLKEEKEGILPAGFSNTTYYFKDPAHIFTIVRDPLLHAELFSKYLAENMHLIKGSSGKYFGPLFADWTYEQKRVDYEKSLKEAQAQAAAYYKAIRVLEPFATKASRKYHENPEVVKKALREYLEKKRLEQKQKEDVQNNEDSVQEIGPAQ